MENENVVNDTPQAVVEPANDCSDTGAYAEGTPDGIESTDNTDRERNRRENSGFRKLRVENENYRREIEKLKSQLSSFSEYENVKAQADRYLDVLVNAGMEKDLEEIRKLDPNVESLESLGEQFIRLIECGIDAKVAYAAVKRATDGNDTPAQPKLSDIGQSGGKSPYYSSKELDRLTAKDLDDPAVYKKAMLSLKRL